MAANKVLLIAACSYLRAACATCPKGDCKDEYASEDGVEVSLLQKGQELIVEDEGKLWQSNPEEDVFKWAESNGTNASLITAALFEHGGRSERGLAANRQVHKGDRLLSLPMSLVLSSAGPPPTGWDTSEPSCMALWNDGVPGARPDVVSLISQRLTMLLLNEHNLGAQSDWSMYLSVLPSAQEFLTFFPLTAGNETLEQFDGLPLAEKARSFQSTYRTLLSSINDNRCFGDSAPTQLGDLLWLASNVKSRHFLTTCDFGETESLCGNLVPICDLANTHFDASQFNVEWPHDKVLRRDGVWELIASRDIAAGEELFDEYDRSGSNERFASVWGFWDPANPVKVASLSEDTCTKLRPAQDSLVDASGLCKPDTLFVRCTFARITYESCVGNM